MRDNQYTTEGRIRFSEVDHTRRITLPGIVNYFQDCSSFHSEYIGFGIDYLKEKNCRMGTFLMADRFGRAAGIWSKDHSSDLAVFF